MRPDWQGCDVSGSALAEAKVPRRFVFVYWAIEHDLARVDLLEQALKHDVSHVLKR